jgi:hypothetical protein
MRSGKVTFDSFRAFAIGQADARFLFGDDVKQYLQTLRESFAWMESYTDDAIDQAQDREKLIEPDTTISEGSWISTTRRLRCSSNTYDSHIRTRRSGVHGSATRCVANIASARVCLATSSGPLLLVSFRVLVNPMAKPRMHTSDQIKAFVEELKTQSDRGTAIVACAVLDELAEKIIVARFIEISGARKEVISEGCRLRGGSALRPCGRST